MISMNGRTWARAAALAATVVAGVTAVGAVAVVRAQSEGNARSIEGTWLVQVQLRSCATQAPIGPPFNSLATFLADGSIVEATEAPAFAVGQRPPAQGRWTRLGASRYSQRMIALVAFDTPPNPPASPGFQRGGQVVTHTMELIDPNTWKSSGTNQFYTAAGVQYRDGCSTATATRFQ